MIEIGSGPIRLDLARNDLIRVKGYIVYVMTFKRKGFGQMPTDVNATGEDPHGPIFSISWKMVISLVGTIVLAVGSIIWTLLSVVYGGLQSEMKKSDDRVIALETSYRDAVTSGIKVQDLITKSPSLDKTIAETHDAVVKIQGSIELLNQKVDSNQEKTKIQLDNIQKQVHSIPGVPK